MNETFLLSNIAPQVGEGFNRNCQSLALPRSLRRSQSSLIDFPSDWAYFEDWTRKLTNQFTDVYVFTIPLYLPAKAADGKWRVVRACAIYHPPSMSDR